MNLQHIATCVSQCLKTHGVKRAGLFGSYVRGEQTPSSDIDILIELPPGYDAFDYLALKYELEDLLGRSVDLVCYRSIKPHLRKYILGEEMRLYG
ncbi:MAG: hypothetical protein CSA97_00615 [Bacteroidetes bacterium]|nr:MAG: hypothetical protein CSA97_00615 [Bacteroidota bacterium]